MFNKFIKKLGSLLLKQEYISPQTTDLSGQVIVVTGASRGIGRAMCEVLLRENAFVFAVSRSLENLKKAFTNPPDNIILLEGDVTDKKDLKRMMAVILRKCGKIDVLINNAAINHHKSILKTELLEFDEIVNTNLRGVFLASKAVLPSMMKSKNGLIINIGSKISHNTNVEPNKVLYAMTKYGVEGFSFALNREIKRFGIRVTCLMPGTVNTFFSRKAKQFLSPLDVATVALMIIKNRAIDFESVLFKSKNQNI